MVKCFRCWLLVSLLVLVNTAPASALLEIDITQGRVEPLPVAVSSFVNHANLGNIARQMVDVINADLERSGLFRPLNQNAFLQRSIDEGQTPNFPDWQIIKAQALLTGSLVRVAGGRIEARVRLWDIYAGRLMIGKHFSASQKNWRRVAHIIANMIYERLTGEKGYFDTQIAFISETGPKEARVKKLAVMDQDGANVHFLTRGKNLVLTPRFSPDARALAYMAYGQEGPRVYLLNVETRRQRPINELRGMTYAPRFSPDGNKVVLSLQEGGNASIYALDLRGGGRLSRLTNRSAIDTSPSYSPDGNQIVFESDVGGTQQLYVMGANGGTARRVTFGKGRYSTPVWSPRGDLIAFTKQISGRFVIGIIRPDGSGERLLTHGPFDEGPTWAPNGRVLIYSRESFGERGGPQLHSVDITGYNERRLPTPSFASDPSWSKK